MEKPSKPRRQPTQTLPTYDVTSGNRTWATLVGGECSLTTASTLLPRNALILEESVERMVTRGIVHKAWPQGVVPRVRGVGFHLFPFYTTTGHT